MRWCLCFASNNLGEKRDQGISGMRLAMNWNGRICSFCFCLKFSIKSLKKIYPGKQRTCEKILKLYKIIGEYLTDLSDEWLSKYKING